MEITLVADRVARRDCKSIERIAPPPAAYSEAGYSAVQPCLQLSSNPPKLLELAPSYQISGPKKGKKKKKRKKLKEEKPLLGSKDSK